MSKKTTTAASGAEPIGYLSDMDIVTIQRIRGLAVRDHFVRMSLHKSAQYSHALYLTTPPAAEGAEPNDGSDDNAAE